MLLVRTEFCTSKSHRTTKEIRRDSPWIELGHKIARDLNLFNEASQTAFESPYWKC